jgi:Tol biopolymer transport system component
MSDSQAVTEKAETLEGWKLIAAYLNRDPRTVKRWEASEGLPVHRHRHSSRNSVYAFPEELDAWRVSRRPESRSTSRPITARRGLALAAILVATVFTTSGGRASLAGQAGSRSSTAQETFRKLWTGLGRISRDGRLVAHIDGNGNVMLLDIATGQDRALTTGASYAGSFAADDPIISPDGRHVAYYWLSNKGPGDVRAETRIVSIQSGDDRMVRVVDGDLLPRDWSADGHWIAASSQTELGMVKVEDGSWHKLKTLGGVPPVRVFFSPNGRHLAYDAPAVKPSDPHDVFVLAGDGSREWALVTHAAQDEVAGWSPDGQRLLFTSDRSGSTSLWAVPFTPDKPGGTPRLMRSALGLGRSLGLGPAGELYLRVTVPDRDVQIAAIDPTTGREAAPAVRPLERFVGSNQQPVWSQDGRFLAYVSYRGGFPIIGIRQDDTGEIRELRPDVPHIRGLAWAPDGKSFVAGGFDLQDRGVLFRIDATTGAVQYIPVAPPRIGFGGFYPQLAQDGRKLYFESPRTARLDDDAVIERDLMSGRERELVVGDLGGHSLSPDGRWIAAVRKSKTITIVPTGTGDLRELTPPAKAELRFNRLAWTPDSRAVIVSAGSPGAGELWMTPIDGAPSMKLDVDASGIAPPAFTGLALHNDGRRLAFVSGSTGQEIWVLENFLSPQRDSP